MIFNSLDIDFIHVDIDHRSCKECSLFQYKVTLIDKLMINQTLILSMCLYY